MTFDNTTYDQLAEMTADVLAQVVAAEAEVRFNYDEGVDEDSLQDEEDEDKDDCEEDDKEDDFHEYDDDCELDNNEDYCEIDAENITNESELRLKCDFKDDEDAIPEKTVR